MRRMAWMAALAAACGGDDPPCDPPSDFGCPAELACETVSGRGSACVTPLALRGKVFDSATGQPMAGARVVAVSEDGAPLAAAVTTIFDGSYDIRLPSPRDASSRPIGGRVRVRAGALGHGNFPDGWREWPVLDMAGATVPPNEDRLILTGPTANLTLVPLAGGPGRGVLSGTVERPAEGGAILVVAETERQVAGRPRGTAAWADAAGGYVIFGLAPGEHRVRAYARGASFASTLVTIDVGETTARADLRLDPASPAATVGGDATGGDGAQVALVVESTWVADTAAGEEPAGLRTAVAGGRYTFSGVPAGRYVVVSREADGTVAVSDAPPVEVAGADVTVAEPLRLAPALPLVGPGVDRAEGVLSAPALVWGDTGGEEQYQVDVINAVGLVVLARTAPAQAGGNGQVAFDVPFVAGQLYRFRARALGAGGALLTKTEDRRGVFFLTE
jgi:hypothetical protein